MGNLQTKELPGTDVEFDPNELMLKILNKGDMLYLCRDLEVRGVVVNAVSTDNSFLWISNSHIVKTELDENKLLEYDIFPPLPFVPKGKRKIKVEEKTSIDLEEELKRLRAAGFNVSARSPATSVSATKYIYLTDNITEMDL